MYQLAHKYFVHLLFTDNRFRVQSTTLKTDNSQWWIQGRGPPGPPPPPLLLDQMRPKGPKKLFVESGLLSYLTVWMTAPPSLI